MYFVRNCLRSHGPITKCIVIHQDLEGDRNRKPFAKSTNAATSNCVSQMDVCYDRCGIESNTTIYGNDNSSIIQGSILFSTCVYLCDGYLDSTLYLCDGYLDSTLYLCDGYLDSTLYLCDGYLDSTLFQYHIDSMKSSGPQEKWS